MYKVLIAIMFVFSSLPVLAANDSLFIASKNDKWTILHKVKSGETVFDIARRYHVAPAMLADENRINFQSPLSGGTILYVPLGTFNKAPNASGNDVRNVYYRVRADDNLYRISKNADVPQRTLQDWNMLPDNSISEGAVLIVAKILYAPPVPTDVLIMDKKDTSIRQYNGANNAADKGQKYTVRKVAKEVVENGKPVTYLVNDTVWVDTLGVYGQLYMKQTQNEKKIVEEKGTAVFYVLANKVQSRYTAPATVTTKQNFVYAFHKTAKRGTIIRVYNPGADKFIYVKVMGGLPETKQYYNSIIGISSDARESLGVLEEKAWVELKYAP